MARRHRNGFHTCSKVSVCRVRAPQLAGARSSSNYRQSSKPRRLAVALADVHGRLGRCELDAYSRKFQLNSLFNFPSKFVQNCEQRARNVYHFVRAQPLGRIQYTYVVVNVYVMFIVSSLYATPPRTSYRVVVVEYCVCMRVHTSNTTTVLRDAHARHDAAPTQPFYMLTGYV